MSDNTQPLSTRATTWGGAGTALAGLIAILGALQLVLPLNDWVSVRFLGTVPVLMGSVLLLASMVVLAVGLRDGTGIAGRSVLGRVGLIVFGCSWLVDFLFSNFLAGFAPGYGGSAGVILGSALDILFSAALIAGAVAIVRAQVLHGFGRWVLLLVAACNAIVTAFLFVPIVIFWQALLNWQVDLVIPVLLLVSGVVYLLDGRTGAIRNRLGAVAAEWRRTTSA